MVVAKVFQLTMMKERGRMGRALTIARTETPSQAETRTLPSQQCTALYLAGVLDWIY